MNRMEYDLRLTAADINVLMRALGELPLKDGVNVFAKINAAVKQQDTAEQQRQMQEVTA